MDTVLIKVDDVSKRFVMHKDKSVKERVLNFRRSRQHRDDFWALRDINLDIKLGETVGLIGHNGSGKSTLLKVIGGIIGPTHGSVSRRGRMAALLELGAGFHPDLTGRDNIYLNAAILGLSKKQTSQYFDGIVDFSGIEEFIDTQVKFYSSGMYVRLAFAIAVHVNPDLLLVDEVLAVGDEPFQRKCMDKIKQFQSEGRTIVLVSHSADQVAHLCDRVVVLNHGEMLHNGDVAEGLRILRDGYALEHSSSQRTTSMGAGSRVAQIESVNVTTAAVSPQTLSSPHDSVPLIPAGADISLRYCYRLSEDHPPVKADLVIETITGIAVARLSSDDVDLRLPTNKGTHEITFSIHQNSFGTGQYLVRASIGLIGGSTLDTDDSAARFEVLSNGFDSGLVRLSVAASIS